MIRKLERGDRDDVLELVRATGNFSTEEVAIAQELIDIFLENPMQHDYYAFVSVDEASGRIAGFLIVGPTPATSGTFDMYWIAVHPDFYGKGIAQSLDAKAVEFVRERGGYLIIAETSSQGSYDRTRSFYRKQRYDEVARIADYYKRGDDLVVYGKRVDS
jgi:ribosomal protein S18 acetylase RimI-like enzyme